MKETVRFRPIWLFPLLLFALALAGCAGEQPATLGTGALAVASTAKVNNQGRGLEVGDLAPDFTLTDANGEVSRLSDWQGQPVVINFWASWCAPCKEEMPEFVKAHQANQDSGLVVLGVNAQESAAQAQEFVDKFAMPFHVALDTRGDVMQVYNVRGLPTTIFIDREGRIAARYAGLLNEELLGEFIAAIK